MTVAHTEMYKNDVTCTPPHFFWRNTLPCRSRVFFMRVFPCISRFCYPVEALLISQLSHYPTTILAECARIVDADRHRSILGLTMPIDIFFWSVKTLSYLVDYKGDVPCARVDLKVTMTWQLCITR